MLNPKSMHYVMLIDSSICTKIPSLTFANNDFFVSLTLIGTSINFNIISILFMSYDPRSRTISRPSLPVTGIPTTSPGSRLVIPPLKPSPSLSNLHIHSHNTPAPEDESDFSTSLPLPREGASGSSASSVINVDLNEGILIQDADIDTDFAEEDSTEVSQPVITTNDESKRYLREQLRKTLSSKQVQKGQASCFTS